MTQRAKDEIKRFATLGTQLRQMDKYNVVSPIEHCLVIRPKNSVHSSAAKSIALTVMAITHGNEVAGLAVVNDLMTLISQSLVDVSVPICFLLGNPAAAHEGLRYLDRDLNRSFEHSEAGTREVARAKAIETVLADTFLLLDIHQTKELAESPFFIFPFTAAGFAFAKKISVDIPVVTHWGAPFSNEGMCTDEYTNRQGGCGITLEIGQNGFHPFHVGVGLHGTIKAMQIAQDLWTDGQLPEVDLNSFGDLNTYTFARIIAYPPTGAVRLAPGFNNFTHVDSEQVIAQIDGREVHADFSGPVLFPQYMRHGEKVRPAELIRILKKINANELPK